MPIHAATNPLLSSNSIYKPTDSADWNLNGAPTSNSTVSTSTPSRRKPLCSRCKRPREGHPRSGCPYANLPAPATKTELTSSKLHHDSPNNRDSIRIGTAAEDVKAINSEGYSQLVKQNNHPPTLATSVAHISRPNFVAAVDTSPSEATVKNERPMQPSTSISSNDNFTSASSAAEIPLEQVSVPKLESESEENTGACNSNPILPPRGSIFGSLSRERNFFVSELSEQALAIIYTIPKVNSDAVVGQAIALKFKAELVVSKNHDEQTY